MYVLGTTTQSVMVYIQECTPQIGLQQNSHKTLVQGLYLPEEQTQDCL